MPTFTGELFNQGHTPTPTGMGTVTVRGFFQFPGTTSIAAGDVIRLAKIAPGYALVNAVIDMNPNSQPTSYSAGILNAAETAVGTTKLSHSALAGSAVPTQMNNAGACRSAIADSVTTFGVVFNSAATFVAGQQVNVLLTLRPRGPAD